MIEIYEEGRNWIKRLSTEQKKNARSLSKLASGNALIVFDILITNSKNYDN
jgi:hypothetical protein